MANIKVLTVNIPENEKNTVLTHYEKMGFEVINSMLVTQRNDQGTVLNTYYKYNMKFDRDQKNADKLWKAYKAYKKKRANLSANEIQSRGDLYMSVKGIFIATFIIAVVLLPFVPMLFGNDFCDFTHSVGFLFDMKREFDAVMFFGAVGISFCAGLAVSSTVELIRAAVTRNKRMLLAIDRIPAIENEIENLVKEASELRS